MQTRPTPKTNTILRFKTSIYNQLSAILLMVCACVSTPRSGYAAGTWVALTNPNVPSGQHPMLMTDGTVIFLGQPCSRLTPDIHGSYVNGTWTTLAPMHDSRTFYSSQVLPDGRIFVCGGEYGSGANRAEIYDPVSNVWTQEPNAPDTVIDNISETLPNGNILEGSPGSDVRIFNIVSNTWSAQITPLGGFDESSWVKLQDGSIVSYSGTAGERYIPSLNQWVADGSLPAPLYGYGYETGYGLLLPNGKALFLGGTGTNAIYTPWTTNYAGIYTPNGATNAGTWTLVPSTPNFNAPVDAPAAMMVNGKVLCCMTATNNGFGSTSRFYEYDYVANSFTAINSPSGSSIANYIAYGTEMLDLPDGTVLVTGQGGLYVYQPSGSPLTNGVPTIISATTNLDGSFHVTGTLFNGISEGAGYGDDWQMNTDFPIARMTNSAGNTFYARTYNWSTCNLMTGTNIVSTDMTLPAGMLAGTYPLVITANGIASAPYSLTISGTPLPAVVGLTFTTVSSNKMSLRWNTIGLTETGYVVQRSLDGTNYSTLTMLSGSGNTNYTDNGVSPLGEYYYRVMGTNSVGLGHFSGIFAASAPVVAVPSPWRSGDIGSVQGAGASGTNGSGTFTVIGSGIGIGTDNDQFQFVYQPVAGDVTITARVTGSQYTGNNALAGVMLRNSSGNDVAGALMAFDSGTQSSVFEHRADAAGVATYGLKVYGEPGDDDDSPSASGGGSGMADTQITANNVTAPFWVRLVRSGNLITGYTSPDGTTWTQQGTVSIVLSPVVYVGLAVSSGTYNLLNSSTFDNVTVTGTPAAIPPPVAEWKLDETSGTTAEDSIDSFDGLCNNVVLGQPGATPDTGYAASFNGTSANISIPPLNLNSNVLTITAWVNRNGTQNAWSGIFFDRESATANGFHFGTTNELRYTWNNNANTYNWSSGLVVPNNQWTFVALVIEPTRARVYMVTNGVLTGATNSVSNAVQGFAGTSYIGQDSSSSSRYFNGLLDEVQFFNQALSPAQIAEMATPPAIVFSTPTNGQEFLTPANINLTATTSGTGGHTINLVQFFNNGNLISQFTAPPYTNTVTNLVTGNYAFSARMYYDSGLEVNADTANVIVEPVPAVPQGVLATALASNLVFVSWPPALGADGYILSRNGTPIASLTSATNYYLNSGLVAGSSYCYTVTATNQVGSSAASASSCVTTPSATTTLTWDAGSSGTGPQDGSDNWGSSSSTWWSGSANTVWTDGALASIGSGASANYVITVLNDVTPAGIIFNQNNGGTYNITNGGGAINLSGTVAMVTMGDGTISATLKGSGALIKTGPGTLTLTAPNTNTGPVTIGDGLVIATVAPWYSPRSIGSGALTVSNGAVAEFTGSHGFGADASGRSATLVNGGTLQFDKENYVSGLSMTAGSIIGAGELRSESTTYTINSAATNSLISCGVNLVSSCTFNVANGTPVVDMLISGNIYGSGNITKSGAGLLQVTGTGTYLGTTTISAGTLQADGSLGTNTVTVANTATLAGGGTVGGFTTVQSGGTIAPGDGGIGSLFFTAGLTLNSGSKITMEISKNANNVLNNDYVSTSGTLTLGGTLTVNNIGTNALAAGDAFNLFDATTFSGNFSAKTLPTLAAGLVWDTSQLANNGIITVAALPAVTVSPASTNLTYGSSALLTAAASGSGTLNYQWYDNHTNLISGATSPTLTLTVPIVAASGNYSVIVTNAYGKATNYSAVTVLPAGLMVNANNTNRIYGATNPVFTASYTGFVNGDTISVLAGAPSLTSLAVTNSPVGSYSITAATGTLSAANYSFTFSNGTLAVNQALLTVYANNTNRVYGTTNPVFTASYSNFVNGDTLAVLSGAPSLTTAAVTNSPVGGYPIVAALGALTATNYSFAFSNATLNVTAAALTITANSTNKVYGQNLIFAGTEFTSSGLANNDAVTNVLLASDGATNTAAAGSYSITVTNALGIGLTNYTISYVNGTLMVTNSSPLVITNGAGLSSSGFALGGTGAPGQTYILLGASNLVPPVVWVPIQTNTADGNGLFNFNDAQATNYSGRYYRIRTP